MSRSMVAVAVLAAGLVAGVGVSTVQAEDKPAAAQPQAAGVTGTWSYQMEGRNNQKIDVTMKLKQDGEKLTGTISGFRGQESQISDGTVKGNDISFKVVRTFNNNEVVTTYTAKLEGDVIKGESEMTRNGQPVTREFEAKRVVEGAKPGEGDKK